MCAGEQNGRIKGRPGVNPLRTTQRVELEREDYEKIKEIILKSGINAAKEISKKEGYQGGADGNITYIENTNFVLGDTTRFSRQINKLDLERVERAIYEAKLQADYILVSVHGHEIEGFEKENPAGFLKEFAHFCIDKGAHAVIGHGPHLLRPIEIYKDRPIFYSLGDFILQLYNVPFAPEDFYERYGLTSSDGVHDLLKKRSKDFTVGLMTDKRMFTSVIPVWEMEEGKLKSMTLYPICLVMEGNKSEIGLPRLCNDPELIRDLLERCASYGTRFARNGDGSYSLVLD
jgi:poly-gamma-glutamate synthesis protein (capsule biosynthesis protein)